MWIAIKPDPAVSATFEQFGVTVASRDFDGDGKAEVVASYVFQNITSSSATKFIDDAPFASAGSSGFIKLKSPISGNEAPRARFGRGSAVVSWKHQDNVVRPCLLVGEPGAHTHGSCEAGKAHLYALPIQAPTDTPVWTLQSPTPTPCGNFGAAVASLRYNSTDLGQQFAISARGEPAGGLSGAGIVFTYRPQ